MGSIFDQLCPRYSGPLTLTGATAVRLWDTFTFTHVMTPYKIHLGMVVLMSGHHVCGAIERRKIYSRKKSQPYVQGMITMANI